VDPITTKTDCKKVTMDVPLDVFLSAGRINKGERVFTAQETDPTDHGSVKYERLSIFMHSGRNCHTIATH